MSIWYWLLAAFVVYAIFKIVGFFILRHQVKQIVNQILNEAETKVLIANVEQIEDVYYLYNKNSSEFLTQGRSLEEISKNFLLRFPGKSCVIEKDTLDVFPELRTALSE